MRSNPDMQQTPPPSPSTKRQEWLNSLFRAYGFRFVAGTLVTKEGPRFPISGALVHEIGMYISTGKGGKQTVAKRVREYCQNESQRLYSYFEEFEDPWADALPPTAPPAPETP